jgi:hypothetical protein
MVYEQLRQYLRTPVIVQWVSMKQSTHEAIKAQLYVLGFRLGYISVLEANGNNGKDRKRIDCAFVKNGKIACAIEIDNSLKMNSINKLHQLSDDVEKIIISYGRQAARSKALYRHKDKLNGIKHFILYPIIA